MSSPHDVAVLVGSLRTGSYCRLLAKSLALIAPETLTLRIVEISDLPFYNEDIEGAQTPASWQEFRRHIKASDAILFVTPEYNRSVPAALKNAIDVGSRPRGEAAWNAKPGAVISLTPGALGCFGANHHLRQSLMSVNVPTLAAPEAYIGGAAGLFDESGALVKEDTKQFLVKFLAAFAAFIAIHRSA